MAHVDVQVHLGDPACVAELESIVWKTLGRAQRTWAPLPVPVDRVLVGAAFPAAGRADIYDDFLVIAGENPDNGAPRRRRVVISLGVRDGLRDLDGWEVAGALAAQIQALVDEQCREHKTVTVPPPAPSTAAASSRLVPAASTPRQEQGATDLVTLNAHTGMGVADGVVSTDAVTEDVPRLSELLATVQQGRPLVAAGPSTNGTHPVDRRPRVLSSR